MNLTNIMFSARNLFSLLGCLSIISCAGIESSRYLPPQSGATAKVNIYVQNILPYHGIDVYKLNYTKCNTEPEYQYAAHLQEASLFAPQKLSQLVLFAANEVIPFRFYYMQYTDAVSVPCKLSTAYTFEENAEYELEMVVIGNRCNLEARKVRSQQNEFKEGSVLLPTEFEFMPHKCE